MYACGVARNVGAEYVRTQARHARVRCETPDIEQHAGLRDPEKFLHAKMSVHSALSAAEIARLRGTKWVLRRALGDTCREIAEDEGLTAKEVQNALDHARERMQSHIQWVGIAFFVILLVWASARDGFKPRQDVADPDKTPKTDEPAPKTTPAPAPTSVKPADPAEHTPVEPTHGGEKAPPVSHPRASGAAPGAPHAKLTDPAQIERQRQGLQRGGLRHLRRRARRRGKARPCGRGRRGRRAGAATPAGDRGVGEAAAAAAMSAATHARDEWH